MWPRIQFDVAWSDLFAAAWACCDPLDRAAAEKSCRAAWPCSEPAIVCTSVRSGFDLLLSALNLPVGSEVLFTALTIPDMPRIAAAHGLVAIPVDLTRNAFTPCLRSLGRAITPATRVIVAAHLFGERIDMKPIVELANRHGLIVVEDCAQAYAGAGYRGHAGAHASLFSFGPIKTATALAGGLAIVRDRELASEMRGLQAAFPRQSRWAYARRVAKFMVLKAISQPLPLGVIMSAATALRLDPDLQFGNLARSYPGDDLIGQIRQQPSAPLLAVLRRRWQTYDFNRLGRRQRLAMCLRREIATADWTGGQCASERDACPWAFPVLTSDPELVGDLRRAGFDATAQSRLVIVEPPDGRDDLEPVNIRRTIGQMVFLPLCPDMPLREATRMAGLVKGRARLPDGAASAEAALPLVLCDT